MRKFQPNGEKHNISLYLHVFTTPSLQALASDNDRTMAQTSILTFVYFIQTKKKKRDQFFPL